MNTTTTLPGPTGIQPKVELIQRLERTAAGLRELKFPGAAALLEESAAELRTVVAANRYWREEREHSVEACASLTRQREVDAYDLRALSKQWREGPPLLPGVVDGAAYAAFTAMEACAEKLEALVASHFPTKN